MLCVDYFGIAMNWIANCFYFEKYRLQISDGNWLRRQECSGFTQSLPLNPRIFAFLCPVQFVYTGLFEMIVGVLRTGHLVLQMQPHVISFYGITSRIRLKFLLFPQVSRN